MYKYAFLSFVKRIIKSAMESKTAHFPRNILYPTDKTKYLPYQKMQKVIVTQGPDRVSKLCLHNCSMPLSLNICMGLHTSVFILSMPKTPLYRNIRCWVLQKQQGNMNTWQHMPWFN